MKNAVKIVKPGEMTLDDKREEDRMHSMFTASLAQIRQNADITQIETLHDASQRYLDTCAAYGAKVTNSSWYYAIGISKQVAELWRNQKRHRNDPRYKDLIDNIDAFCAMNREQLMMDGRVSPVVGIWLQKNYDGFTDVPDLDEVETVEEEEKTAAQIEEKYKYLLKKQ